MRIDVDRDPDPAARRRRGRKPRAEIAGNVDLAARMHQQPHPPPKDRIITQPDSVYFSFPKLRWSVCHLRE
ncbi:hypothetical protein ACIKT0_11115, partial [Hansschlegelia beijingensis]